MRAIVQNISNDVFFILLEESTHQIVAIVCTKFSTNQTHFQRSTASEGSWKRYLDGNPWSSSTTLHNQVFQPFRESVSQRNTLSNLGYSRTTRSYDLWIVSTKTGTYWMKSISARSIAIWSWLLASKAACKKLTRTRPATDQQN